MFLSKKKEKCTFPSSNCHFYSHKNCSLLHRPINVSIYCKVPRFLDARKLCCNLPKIQTKRPNLRVFSQEDANIIANSEDPNQTAPRGAV